MLITEGTDFQGLNVGCSCLSNLAIHCGRYANRVMKMIQDQDTEGGPNAIKRDPAHLVVHVSQVPQKRPISPIPKPQPDGPPNQDGSTDDDSPAAQQYLRLANHLLLPHRVSRGRGGAAGAAPALAPAPPTQAQAPSVIGLRLPPERPRPLASWGCACRGRFLALPDPNPLCSFQSKLERGSLGIGRRSAGSGGWHGLPAGTRSGFRRPAGVVMATRRRLVRIASPTRLHPVNGAVSPSVLPPPPRFLARPRSLLARASPDRHDPGPAPRISHRPSPGLDPRDLRPPGTCGKRRRPLLGPVAACQGAVSEEISRAGVPGRL